MRACTMANGAVFFIPDHIERKTNSISYAEFTAEESVPEKPARRFFLFGKGTKAAPPSPDARSGPDRLAV